jgi:hypothetical protein
VRVPNSPGRNPSARLVGGDGPPRIGVDLLLLRCPEIWAVARLGQVGVILSEDFNPGAGLLNRVSFANPLDPKNDLATLG